VRVAILGALLVADDAGRPVEVGGARLRALLTRLALDPGRAVGVDALVEDLWGDTPPADRLNALQSLVSRLRRALPGAPVESGPTGYRLALGPDRVDALEFERLADAGRQALAADPAAARRLLTEALALWRGPALADAAGRSWAEDAKARLDERRLAATEDRIDAELELGGHAAVLPELAALARDHPLRERIRGQHVRALYAAGRQADALAAYEDVRRLLAEELGVDPSPALQQIQLRVLRAAPEPQPAAAPRTNVPAQLTSFVGRDADLAEVTGLLDRHRLVTLVGPGGAGKTRLAGETAVRVLAGFPDGAWLAELAPVTGGAEVPQAVLAAIGLAETGPREPGQPAASQADAMTRLVDLLAGRCALIVLDNCEHLIESAARVAAELLARCPRLRILATSREPLGITGEALAPVAPLGLPPADATPAQALRHPAVTLLADRVAAVRPGFQVNDETVAPVIEICRRLDGMPLAIELAAARMRSLPVTEVAARLDDRFRLLTGGSRAALPRHQTLRAVVAWSWDLLTSAEAALADRVAVFPGGITPDAARAVCAGGPVAAVEVPDLLAALTDKSLLQQMPGLEPRYRMLETLREFGTERLAVTGDVAAVKRAHARHFLALAEEAEPHLRGPEQLEWLPRVIAERDNLLAAMRFTVDTGDADTAVRLGAALAWYWTLRNEHGTAAAWLSTVADVPGAAPGDARALCIVVGVISRIASVHDLSGLSERIATAHAAYPEPWSEHPMLGLLEPITAMVTDDDELAFTLLDTSPEPADPWGRATRHLLAAMLYENEGRFDEHRDSLKRALEAYRDVGERWGLSATLSALGSLRLADGDVEGSVAAYAEAHQLMGQITANEDASFTRTRLAQAYARGGDLDRARAELVIARAEAERFHSAIGLVTSDLGLGELARETGDRVEARRRVERALGAARITPGGLSQLTAMVLASLATLDAEDGEAERGRDRIREAVSLPGADRDMPVIGAVALAAAFVELRAGAPERSARLFGAALALRGAEDRGNPQVDLLRRELTAALGAETLHRLYDDGAALPREQAMGLLRGNAVDAT
jgi:predicted ATPase/DNA-binding SARP family transcriptional activator/tetratricopeptide (TPR) repeat protein